MRVTVVTTRLVRRLAIGEFESVEQTAEVTAELDDGDDRAEVQRQVDAMARADLAYSAVLELEAARDRRSGWADDAWRNKAASQALLASQLDAAKRELQAADGDAPTPAPSTNPTGPTMEELKARKADLTEALKRAAKEGDAEGKKAALAGLAEVKKQISALKG